MKKRWEWARVEVELAKANCVSVLSTMLCVAFIPPAIIFVGNSKRHKYANWHTRTERTPITFIVNTTPLDAYPYKDSSSLILLHIAKATPALTSRGFITSDLLRLHPDKGNIYPFHLDKRLFRFGSFSVMLMVHLSLSSSLTGPRSVLFPTSIWIFFESIWLCISNLFTWT